MPRVLSAYGIGLLFGLGLVISQMVDPAKVLAFLDVAGAWDPSLAFVMFGAVAVTAIGYRLVFARQAPVLADRFQVPNRSDIDKELIVGSALFGVGWGLAGFCPGPALTALGLGRWDVLLFVLAMLAGMAVHRLLPEPKTA